MSSESAPAAVMDRIASMFGGNGAAGPEETTTSRPADELTETEVVSEPETTAETTASDDLFEFDWEDGKRYSIPSALKEAVMRGKDYTQKTQELAESRRSVDHEKSLAESARLESAFAKSISDEQRDIGLCDAYLKQVASIDWSKMSTEDMYRQKIELDQVKDRRAALAESISGKRTKFISDMQAKINDLRGKSRELASKSIDGFSEETERTMRDYAKSEGLTEREIDLALLDPRSFKLMWKASQFDKIKAGTAKAGEKAQRADRVVRPGVAGERMPKETASKLNYQKAMKGAVTSAQKARVIEDRLAGVFGKK